MMRTTRKNTRGDVREASTLLQSQHTKPGPGSGPSGILRVKNMCNHGCVLIICKIVHLTGITF